VHIRRALDDEEDERDRRAPRARSIRQQTSADVSIRQHTSAYVSIRQHTPFDVPSLMKKASEIEAL
jgi:hypothetical protein